MIAKPLMYLDSDTAISCLMRSLCTAGFGQQAEQLLGLTISNPDGVRHAQQIIAGLPTSAMIEKAKRGALEMLGFASNMTKAAAVQAPIDLC